MSEQIRKYNSDGNSEVGESRYFKSISAADLKFFDDEAKVEHLRKWFVDSDWMHKLSQYELEHPKLVESEGLSPDECNLYLHRTFDFNNSTVIRYSYVFSDSDRIIQMEYQRLEFSIRNPKATSESYREYMIGLGYKEEELDIQLPSSHGIDTALVIAKGNQKRLRNVVYANLRLSDYLYEPVDWVNTHPVENRVRILAGWRTDFLPPEPK